METAPMTHLPWCGVRPLTLRRRKKNGLPGRVAARHDGQFQTHVSKHTFPNTRSRLATRCARVVHLSSALGGRGECRAPAAPAASCAIVVIERTRVTTSTPASPGIPARNGFNGFLRALPGDRALLPPSPAD